MERLLEARAPRGHRPRTWGASWQRGRARAAFSPYHLPNRRSPAWTWQLLWSMPTPPGTCLTPRHFRHRYQPSCPPQRAQEGKGFLNTEPSAAGAEQPRGGQRAHARLLNCCCGSCEAGGLTLRWPTLGSCPTEAPAALQQLDPPVGLGGCMRPPTQPHGPPGCRDAYGTGTSG